MAEYSAPATLTSSAGSVLFNRPTDVGFHDPTACSGLEGKPARTVIEDKARTDGANVYPALLAAREVVLGGWVRSSTLSGRESFLATLEAVVDALRAANGTYVWEASTGTKTLTVRFLQPVIGPGRWIKRYHFALVAGNPVIS